MRDDSAPASEAHHPAVDPLPGEGRPLEFYRLDISRRLVAIVLLCPLPLLAGLFLLGYLILTRPVSAEIQATPPETLWLGALGLALVIAGPLSMIWALKGVVMADDYILLRTDGLVEHLGPQRGPLLHRWDDLAQIGWDPSPGAIVLHHRDGQVHLLAHRFAGITGPELASRLEDVRRKATFGLL